MDIGQLEQALVKLDAPPGNLAHHRNELQAYASWCIDRILALSGADANESEKSRLMAAQTRVRLLLARSGGATITEE